MVLMNVYFLYPANILQTPASQLILHVQYFNCIMAKNKDNKSAKDDVGLNKLSRLMMDQNNSLRKLLEKLSQKEKETKVKKNL